MAEIHRREGKRKLEEESVATEGEKPFQYVIKTFIGEDGEEYYDSDDDEIRYADGRRVCVRLQKEYNRQIQESEGFDITLDLELGTRISAYFMAQRGEENDPIFVDVSDKALEHFNSEHNTNYKFVKNLTVNTLAVAGVWCYITFLGTDATDEPNTSKTFQAKAWRKIGGNIEVTFCRLKKEGGRYLVELVEVRESWSGHHGHQKMVKRSDELPNTVAKSSLKPLFNFFPNC